MTVEQAVLLVEERRSQLAAAQASARLWRRQVIVAQRLLNDAYGEVNIAVQRSTEAIEKAQADG